MKKIIIITSLLFTALACTEKGPSMEGKWKVLSSHYKATYEVTEENDSIKAKALYYNDGTTILRASDGKDYYLFKKPIINKATSETTNHKAPKKNIGLDLVHKDTLKVTTYIMHSPLTETWVRTK
ncbi:MAG: hypothetical protein BM557_07795 [Flavobacterium sp. MedPE-SWcel]|uniref:hypothetical protein n=1 Tax=uncultured Flavobacterium sp. TaxID=165435 RepID=UPI000912412E|nr:hypothetical protein [uncultured Flavobacterium sp.]OIQ18110.1 MAG: hypothetical protein BM557_07795 [Flavobacterium sp. MedPE-SWcel]